MNSFKPTSGQTLIGKYYFLTLGKGAFMFRNNLYINCVFAGFVLMGTAGYSLLSLQMIQPENAQLNHAKTNHHILEWILMCLGIILFITGGFLWHHKTYKVTKQLRELNRKLTAIQGEKGLRL